MNQNPGDHWRAPGGPTQDTQAQGRPFGGFGYAHFPVLNVNPSLEPKTNLNVVIPDLTDHRKAITSNLSMFNHHSHLLPTISIIRNRRVVTACRSRT